MAYVLCIDSVLGSSETVPVPNLAIPLKVFQDALEILHTSRRQKVHQWQLCFPTAKLDGHLLEHFLKGALVILFAGNILSKLLCKGLGQGEAFCSFDLSQKQVPTTDINVDIMTCSGCMCMIIRLSHLILT